MGFEVAYKIFVKKMYAVHAVQLMLNFSTRMILGKLQYDFADGHPNLVKPLTNIKNEKVNNGMVLLGSTGWTKYYCKSVLLLL